MKVKRRTTKRLTDSEYLEHLTRKLFISGFAWEPVKKKWPRFRELFYAFDPKIVADIPGELVEHISNDPGIIRNRVKIKATVKNAQEFLDIAHEHGSFRGYLRSLDGLAYEKRAKDIAKRVACVGPNTVYYFLLDVGEKVPAVKPPGVG